MNLQTQSRAIADGVKNRVGFDPFTIITILIPLLSQCFSQQGTSQTQQEYLNDHYDDVDGSFDQSLVNRCRPQTRRAARQDGQRRLSRNQLDAITVATLERARTADPDVVSAVCEEVA